MNQSIASNQQLERLHIRWILAKNRSGASDLSPNELTQLLSTGRILWNDLDEKEQKSLKNSGKPSTSNDFETKKYNDTENINLVKSCYGIVQSLLLEMDKYRSKYYSDDAWDSYSPKQKKFAREEIFKNEFHLNPMDFGFITYKSMI